MPDPGHAEAAGFDALGLLRDLVGFEFAPGVITIHALYLTATLELHVRPVRGDYERFFEQEESDRLHLARSMTCTTHGEKNDEDNGACD